MPRSRDLDWIVAGPWLAARRDVLRALAAFAASTMLLVTMCGFVTVAADESVDVLSQRRAYVEGLDDAAKTQLKQKYERFTRLDERERERMRTLHRQIEQDPDGKQLEQVMQRYNQWLATLTPYQVDELGRLAPAERVEKIRQMREAEKQETSRWLGHEDAAAFANWFIARLVAHQEELQLPQPVLDELDHPESEFQDPLVTLRRLFARGSGRRTGPPTRDEKQGAKDGPQEPRGPRDRFDLREALGKLPPPSEEALAELAGVLSRPARSQLLAAKSVPERQLLIWGWVWQSLRRGPPSVPVNQQDLLRFFDALPENQRQHLLSLSPESMQQTLRWLYFNRNRRPPDRPDGPPRKGPENRPARQGPVPPP